MTETTDSDRGWLNGWRLAGWGAAAALLALPAIAMQFSGAVAWTIGDFLFAAIMLAALGGGIELAVRVGRGAAHKAGLIIAALAGFATVWVNAAVGIIGDGPINAVFTIIVFAALLASLAFRLSARAVSVIAAAMIGGILVAGTVAEFTSRSDWGPVLFVAGLWVLPALLLYRAGRD